MGGSRSSAGYCRLVRLAIDSILPRNRVSIETSAVHPSRPAISQLDLPGHQSPLRQELDRAHLQPRLRRLGQVFTDQVVACAIVDRLPQRATVINIRGHRYRMRAQQEPLEAKKQA